MEGKKRVNSLKKVQRKVDIRELGALKKRGGGFYNHPPFF